MPSREFMSRTRSIRASVWLRICGSVTTRHAERAGSWSLPSWQTQAAGRRRVRGFVAWACCAPMWIILVRRFARGSRQSMRL